MLQLLHTSNMSLPPTYFNTSLDVRSLPAAVQTADQKTDGRAGVHSVFTALSEVSEEIQTGCG